MAGAVSRGSRIAEAISELFRVPQQVARPENQVQLVLTLTLFVLFLHAGDGSPVNIPIKLLVIVGFLWKACLRDWLYWVFTSIFVFYANYLNWDIIDNHDYLIMYWVFSIACLAWIGEFNFEWNARALIGLAMSLAALNKLLSPQYMSGDMFSYHLLLDPRFHDLATFVTGLELSDLSRNFERWMAFRESSSLSRELPLNGVEEVRALASFMTWWGLVIDVLVGACFLIPACRVVTKIGNIALLIFIFTTYPIANVVGFGWILAVLGVAQCEPSQEKMRFAYLLSFLAVLLFKLV
ncbi:hypothetical protein IEN85_04745 [Pelagicoccus sp. NFK12]|uniref:Uncharacterized protein n=1 Tax=Pelagicoccus enzymogenes TaxID=2773457 RepID=A0A927F8C3_9BACT|nr:hypothetical protein [Pelagicoccus enzymogenes]MBD5778788.1 hypothetical protein [Pelagicoccus enzymogenes]